MAGVSGSAVQMYLVLSIGSLRTSWLSNCEPLGVHVKLVKVIAGWSRERIAFVVIDGVSSDPRTICKTVFQGTV